MRPSAGLRVVLAFLLAYSGAVLALPIENGGPGDITLQLRSSVLFKRNEGGDGDVARSIEADDAQNLDSRNLEPSDFDPRDSTEVPSSSDLDARGLPLGAIAKLAKAAVAPARRLGSAAFSRRTGAVKSPSVKAKAPSRGSNEKKAKGRSTPKKSVTTRSGGQKGSGSAKRVAAASKHPKKSKKSGEHGKKARKPRDGKGKKKSERRKKDEKDKKHKKDKRDKDGKRGGKKRDGNGQTRKPRFSRVRNLNFNIDPATIVAAGTGIAGMVMN